MSHTGSELGVVVASGGLHLKLLGFWVVVVIVVLALGLLVRHTWANKRRSK